jgi:hypothetical protein
MMGEADVPGLYLHAASDIFAKIEAEAPDMTVIISFYEIYCGKLRDLLNEK